MIYLVATDIDAYMFLLQHTNFELDQEGMKTQLLQLNALVKFYDPDFYNYLGMCDYGHDQCQ